MKTWDFVLVFAVSSVFAFAVYAATSDVSISVLVFLGMLASYLALELVTVLLNGERQ